MGFLNFEGSHYYKLLKVAIANEVLFYNENRFIVNGIPYIPNKLDTIKTLSQTYNIPKSSVSRAIQNILDDGDFIERTGSHGKGIKYKIILTKDKASEFLDHVFPTLQHHKKNKNIDRRGIKNINPCRTKLMKWDKTKIDKNAFKSNF